MTGHGPNLLVRDGVLVARTLTWGAYVRGTNVMVPTKIIFLNGPRVEVDPVEVAPIDSPHEIASALVAAFERGNEIVPGRGRNYPSPPAVVRAAGVSSWKEFVEGTVAWTIKSGPDGWQVGPRRLEPGKGKPYFADPPDPETRLAPEADYATVAAHVAERIHRETPRHR